ncbi:MAG TPA: ABC transporter ATP-binding protein [Bryobacteraceae bacterium]|nr:ABC transporter ATP-binding protein [Bryobacteraceae bacterium]
MSDVLLEVAGLRVSYGAGERSMLVLRELSFAIRSGEAVGLLGESGSGKTSTALAILGLLPPVALADGSVRLRGQELVNASEEEFQHVRGAQISFIPQEPSLSLNPVMRAVDHVAAVVRAHTRLSRRERLERAQAALKLIGLEDERLHNSYPHQLSGGQQQRVLIAQAMVCRPALVIADEPTGSLDPATEQEVLALLRGLVEQLKVSLFLITHDPRVLGAIADRVMVMYAGRIVESGPASDVLQSPLHPYTRGLLRCLLQSSRDAAQPRDRHVPSIAGPPPDFHQLPPGCSFEPRCQDRMKRCNEAEPSASILGAREVSCFLYEQRR